MQAIRPADTSAFSANLARAMLGQVTRTYGAAQPAPRQDSGVQVGVAFVFKSRITVTVGVYGSLDAWGVAQIIGNSATHAHDIAHAIDACKPAQGAHAGESTGANNPPAVTNPATPDPVKPTQPAETAPHNGNHYGQDKPHSNNGNHYGQIANGNNGRGSFHVTA